MPKEVIDDPAASPDEDQEQHVSRPFFVDDSETVWIIEKGHLDLFFVQEDTEGFTGPRRHVLRAHTGQAVFGLDIDSSQLTAKLLAVGSPNVRLKKIALRYLKELQPDGRPNATGTVLLENWVRALSHAISSSVPPKTYVLAEPGKQIKAGPGNHIVCNHDVVWVKHLQGASWFLSDPAIVPVENGFHFPLIPQTWLDASQTSTIECVETRDFLTLDPEWESLKFFHSVFVSALKLQLLREDDQNKARLQSKHASAQKQIRLSLSWLAAPVTGEAPRAFLRGYKEPNALLAACQIVGEAIAIDIRGPSRGSTGSQDALRQIATSSKVRVRKVLLRDFWWKDDHGPLLGYMQEGNRPVALLPGRKGYEIHDPSDGTTQRVD